MRSKTKKSISILVGIWTFLLVLIFKVIFSTPAYAFLSSLDACAANPECVAVVGSELSPAVAAPTAEAAGTTAITTTTATGATSSSVEAVAGITVVGDMRLSGVAAFYIWNRDQNEQAQKKVKEKYCTANPSDSVCGFAWNVTGQGMANGQPNCQTSGVFYPRTLYATSISFSSSTFTNSEFYGYYQGCPKDIVVLDGQLSPSNFFAGGTGTTTKISNPPQWKDWPQEKRDAAVKLLNDSDWQGLITSMPNGGTLNPGDTINAPTIVIPGTDGTKTQSGSYTIPDSYPNAVPSPSPDPSPSGSPPPNPSPSPSPPTASGGDQSTDQPPDDSSNPPPEQDGPDDQAADSQIDPSDQYLDDRAKELASLLDDVARRKRTIAVARVRNPDGTEQQVVASSNGYLNPAQQNAIDQAEETGIPDDKSKTHAEIRIISWAEANGKTVESIAASRNICSVCWAQMQPRNIRPATHVNLPQTQQ